MVLLEKQFIQADFEWLTDEKVQGMSVCLFHLHRPLFTVMQKVRMHLLDPL